MIEPTELEVRAFVGKAADRTIDRWLTTDHRASQRRRFNPWAFWFTLPWLAYRKMYRAAALYIVQCLLLELIVAVVYGLLSAYVVITDEVILGSINVHNLGLLLSILLISSVYGVYGNRWYYEHVCHSIARVRRLGISEEEAIPILSNRGGTSLVAAICFVIMSFIVQVIAAVVLSFLMLIIAGVAFSLLGLP